jgi:Carboxypeptidase regulatory-like domain
MRQTWVVAIVLAALLLTVASCAPGKGSPPTGTGRLRGVVVAGPTCPVVTDPPQSGCGDRPVAGATLVIVDAAGDEVATATTGDDGRFRLDLPAGTYEVQPHPVDGLMGTAPPVTATVVVGQSMQVTVSYDTGIR